MPISTLLKFVEVFIAVFFLFIASVAQYRYRRNKLDRDNEPFRTLHQGCWQRAKPVAACENIAGGLVIFPIVEVALRTIGMTVVTPPAIESARFFALCCLAIICGVLYVITVAGAIHIDRLYLQTVCTRAAVSWPSATYKSPNPPLERAVVLSGLTFTLLVCSSVLIWLHTLQFDVVLQPYLPYFQRLLGWSVEWPVFS